MNVLIVEDEALIAEDLKDMVEECGYSVVAIASSAKQVYQIMETETVQAVLLDIRIKGDEDGIAIGNHLNKISIPFIYISAQSDQITVKEASKTQPFGYLVKPIRQVNLMAILTVLENAAPVEQALDSPVFSLTKGGYTIELQVHQISHLRADGSYTYLYQNGQEHLASKSLKQLLEEDSFASFKRIHKSYAVNPLFITGQNSKEMLLSIDVTLPIGRGYKD